MSETIAPRRGLERWIYWLEDLIRIPFTQLTFGLDVILGLVPIVGDFAGLALGLPVLFTAAKRKLPLRVLIVMLANVLLDAVVGSIPLLGNLFDLLWKAHRKNLLLLETPEALAEVLREAWWKASALAVIVCLLAAAMIFLLVWAIWIYFRVVAEWGLPAA